MPKRLNVLLVIVSALLLGVLPLRAQPNVDELLRFADDAPFNAAAFGAIRTDSAYIETLDGVIAQVTSALPSDLVPPDLSLSAVLDLVSSQITGSGFNQGLRPLLGDVAAFALGDLGAQIDDTWYNDNDLPLALYLAIRDRNAVNEAVNQFLVQAAGSLTITDTPDGTLYAADLRPAGYFLVRADSLIIALTPDMLPTSGASLNDNPYFQSAVGSLPAESYNIIGYVDVAYLGSVIVGRDSWQPADSRIAQMLIFRSLGVTAGGATILNGTTLTGDVVLSPGNLQPLESFGIDVRGAPEPINPALLNRLPSDSALVWHGTYPLGALDLVDRSISGAVEGLFGAVLDADPVSRATFDALGASLLFYPNAILTNLGGLTFEDYAEWLQGDYLVVMRPNLSYLPRSPGLPFDGGIILEAANPESARERMLRFARELTLMLRAGSLPYHASLIPVQTRIADADAVLLRAQVQNFSDRSVSYIDFAIAADDQVMAIGTLDFVETVLGNANADSSPFDADQGVLLPESRLALYVNPRALTTMALPILGYNFDFDRPRIQVPLLALTLFDSSTASLTFDEAGNTVMRFTLTLAQDQAANAAAATATYEAFAATAQTLFPTATWTPAATPFVRPIGIGETITGSLAAGARDAYTLTLTAGASLVMDMDSTAFDTYLELRDLTGLLIAENDDRGDGTLNSRLRIDLPPGRYAIIARGYSTFDSGAYTLSVQVDAPQVAEGGISLNTPISGSIARGGSATYALTVDAPASFTFDLSSTAFDTVLEIFDAANNRVGYNDDFPGLNTNSRIENLALAAGTYRVVVRSYGNAGGGAFNLLVTAESGGGAGMNTSVLPFAMTATAVVQQATDIAATMSVQLTLAATAAPMTITVGQTVTATLARGQRNLHTFTAAAGDIITIDMEASFDTYLRLLDSTGRMIAENDDRGDGTFNSRILSFSIPAAGTYTISAGSFGDASSGEYTLTLSRG